MPLKIFESFIKIYSFYSYVQVSLFNGRARGFFKVKEGEFYGLRREMSLKIF